MAFLPILLMNLAVLIIIIAVICSVIFVSGVIFFVVGMVHKNKPKYQGKKSPKVCIAIGITLMLLPFAAFSCLIIGGIIQSGKGIVGYDNLPEKWQSEWVSDRTAAEEAVEQILVAAEAGDREKVAENFALNVQNSMGFQKELDAFLEAYPKGLSLCERDGGLSHGSSSYNYGSNVQIGTASYTCMLDGGWYYIWMNFCYENTDCPADVGVTAFYIENLEANALDINYPEDQHLVCNIQSKEEVTARLIGGYSFVFEPTPQRVITVEQMMEYANQYDTLYQLIDEIGEPNVRKKYSSATGYDYYYELAAENGEPRYVHIVTSTMNGKLLDVYICSNKETFYDQSIHKEREKN